VHRSGRAPTFFQKELKNQDAVEGDDITLHCELSKPGVHVEWRKGGVVLQPGKKYEMKQEKRVQKLFIRNLEPEDSGYYTCDAGNQLTTASLAVQALSCCNFLCLFLNSQTHYYCSRPGKCGNI
uniref:Ig-like domain-containing protein n=1 Tax=Oryzias latipes TaxID=8090 RepID=A0A3B3H3L6_ORYLA